MWSEAKLNAMLSKPSPELVADISRLSGDIMILGAGGKIGPALAVMAKQAIAQAGIQKKVIAVSRSLDEYTKALFQQYEVATISADLMNQSDLSALPDTENIVFLAGRKFGTAGAESLTWSANASLPTLVTRRFRGHNIVAFSSGNIYPKLAPFSGGATESVPAAPIGEYAMSSLARERIFEYAALEYGTKVLVLRLNFAVDLRYGVLFDIAKKIMEKSPVDLAPSCFNCVWQGYVNEVTLRALGHTDHPAVILNITGPETASVAYAAKELGRYLDMAPVFSGQESETTFLSNSTECFKLFGYPKVTLGEMLQWQAQWLQQGGRNLNKPTHFEEHGGQF